MAALPGIDPMPPVADRVLPWDGPVADTVATIGRARSDCGDTFVVHSGEDRYLFLFTPAGLGAIYAVPEAQASKSIADWKMLRRKLPDELFIGRLIPSGEPRSQLETQRLRLRCLRQLDRTEAVLSACGRDVEGPTDL
ncbi:MAG: hypothetical protein OXL98_13355 [Acidimicrobiaceae bacterium]|nr:hypothetical protein [Acidimicrobiaceae bacterium]